MSAIDTLTGRALEREIGERVMGLQAKKHILTAAEHYQLVDWRLVDRDGRPLPDTWACRAPDQVWGDCPCYSSDIAAAWQVVEELRRRGWSVFVVVQPWVTSSPVWSVDVVNRDDSYRAYADSAPEAICRAALRAVAAQEEVAG